MPPMRLTALITGTVQGVGYRRYVQRYARDLNLAGYAENLSDDLARLLHWLRRGPPHARVQDVQTQQSEATGLKDFHLY